jgi:copper homeostasis protein
MSAIPILEICVDSLEGVQVARDAGANRVELCASFLEAGITPSYATIALAVRQNIAVNVLVRPRAGDFVYSSLEVETMLTDIWAVKNLAANGVVIGALNNNFELDLEVMHAIVAAARPLEITFHRAFDEVVNPFEALEGLIELGIDRVLTSGQQESAELGIPLLAQLVRRAQNRISIMPGAGINGENAKRIWCETGARELHFSAFERLERPTPKIVVGTLQPRMVTTTTRIKAVLASLES